MTILLPLLLSLSLAQPPGGEAERLEALEREIADRERSAREIRARAEATEDAVERLQNQLTSTAAALQDAEARATQLEQDLQSIGAREAIALEERDARSLELSQVLGALQNLERSRPPALVVAPNDAQEAALAAIALSSLTPRLAEIVEERKAEIERLAALRTEKIEAQRRLDETNSALSERRRILEGLLAERRSVFRREMTELESMRRETQRLAQEASSIRDLIRRLRSIPSSEEVLRTYRRSRRDLNLPEVFTDAEGQLDLPASGIVEGRYGERDDTGDRRDAIELRTRSGAVVTSPFGGTVKWAAEFGALGNVLIVDVGGGYATVLVGLDSFVVEKGQRIGAGEPVGIMSPRQEAPRLQMQVRRDGRPIDPTPWFKPGAI